MSFKSEIPSGSHTGARVLKYIAKTNFALCNSSRQCLNLIIALCMLMLIPIAGYSGCNQIYTTTVGQIGKYEYNSSTDTWDRIAVWDDSSILDYDPKPGDAFEDFPSEGVWVLYVENSGGGNPVPPGGGGPGDPPTDPYGVVSNVSMSNHEGGLRCDDDDPAELPKMTVTAPSYAGWTTTVSYGYAFVYTAGGGSSAGPVRVCNTVLSAYDWAQFSQQLHSITYDWAVQDVEMFRTNGTHVINPQFSLIPWQELQVNWDLYGADDPSLTPEEVVGNFINQVETGNAGCT